MAQFIKIDMLDETTHIFNLDQVVRFYREGKYVNIETVGVSARTLFGEHPINHPSRYTLRKCETEEEAETFLRKIFEKLDKLDLTMTITF